MLLQYLDCVHQLWAQHPLEFEFNLELLRFIAHHIYSAAFGNFVFRNDRERIEKNCPSKTVSIWSYVLGNRGRFHNSLYAPRRKGLHARYKERELRFWREFFGSFEDSVRKDVLTHRHVFSSHSGRLS